jgi:hypothetical protein
VESIVNGKTVKGCIEKPEYSLRVAWVDDGTPYGTVKLVIAPKGENTLEPYDEEHIFRKPSDLDKIKSGLFTVTENKRG